MALDYETPSSRVSKAASITGWIIGGLPALMMIGTGTLMYITSPGKMKEGMKQFGYPESVALWIVVAEVVSALLYLIPRTSVLGAILMTGYFGGATATHVRVNDPKFVVPIIVGIFIWLGLYLRDRRVRALIPLRS
ncbi:MAG TPA: DoxX family protein [Humisphaera sp.]|jgi:hypothetical protein|nr:DoxX family protein [Humisphaera sp.]